MKLKKIQLFYHSSYFLYDKKMPCVVYHDNQVFIVKKSIEGRSNKDEFLQTQLIDKLHLHVQEISLQDVREITRLYQSKMEFRVNCSNIHFFLNHTNRDMIMNAEINHDYSFMEKYFANELYHQFKDEIIAKMEEIDIWSKIDFPEENHQKIKPIKKL